VKAIVVGSMFSLAGLLHFSAAALEPAVTVHKTPAGLTFRYTHLPAETDQVVYFAWTDGTAIGRPGKEAVPGLAAELVMQGPRGMSASEFEEELNDYNASWSLSGSTNHVSGYLAASPAKFAGAAAVFGKIFTDPALPVNKLALYQESSAAASRQNAEYGDTLAKRLFLRMILGDTLHMRYYTEPAIFETVGMADIESWRREILVRDTLVVMTAGPMTADQVGPQIDRMFAGLPQSGNRPPQPTLAMRSSGKLIVLEKPVVQTAIAAGGPVRVAIEPDGLRVVAAVSVLGSGAEGRLFEAIRERLGASYGAYAELEEIDAIARGLYINAEVANENVADALAAIRAEYVRFLTSGVTDEELETAKEKLVANMRENLDKPLDLARTLLGATLNGFPADYHVTFEQRVRGYTRDQINAAIAESFPKALTIVVVTPSAAGLPADCVIKAPEEIARCE
jgi:zinc protease